MRLLTTDHGPPATDHGQRTTDPDLKNVRTIAAAVAVGAADEHVAEELHFDLLEAGAATTFALALARIEAEGAGVEAALFRGVGLGEQFAEVVERAEVNGGVGRRRFGNSWVAISVSLRARAIAPRARASSCRNR